MLDGLEGVMMLAAASGEDLGRVSDIVTDALTAFGHGSKTGRRICRSFGQCILQQQYQC